MSESATPESGALSVDQAIAKLAPEPVEQAAPEAPVEAAAEPEEIEGEASAPEDSNAEPEEQAEGETEAEAEPEAVAPADPPKYWSHEAKAKFAELPPELQAVVLAQEGPREEATAKAKADAAEQSRVATTEMQKVAELAEGLAERLPQWIARFEDQWGAQAPDWVAFGQEHGAEAMTMAKTQYEADRQKLSDAAAETAKAQALAQEAFFKAEHAKLAEIAPDLANPETGPAKRSEVSQYLVKQGVAPSSIEMISAVEMNLAHKAMLWDQAQAAIKARPKATPAAPAATSPVRPAAALAQSSPQRSALSAAQARFNLNPSADNAEALLLARKAG